MLARFMRGVAVVVVRLLAVMAHGSPLEAPVDTVTVLYGKHASGSVQSLAVEDAEAMRFCRFIVPNAEVYPITVRFEGHLSAMPSTLCFSVVGKSAAFGQYVQSLNLYDWTKNLYEPNTNSTSPLPKTNLRMDCYPWGDASRYVRGSDKKVMGLVRVRVVGLEVSLGWPVDYDHVWFSYEPAA